MRALLFLALAATTAAPTLAQEADPQLRYAIQDQGLTPPPTPYEELVCIVGEQYGIRLVPIRDVEGIYSPIDIVEFCGSIDDDDFIDRIREFTIVADTIQI